MATFEAKNWKMENWKIFLEYAGLICSAICGVLGIAFPAHDDVIPITNETALDEATKEQSTNENKGLKPNTAQGPKKKLNKWGKRAIVGVGIGLLISGVSKILEVKIQKIETEKNQAYFESILSKDSSIAQNLKSTSNTLDTAVNKLEYLMNPMFPLKLEFTFNINLDSLKAEKQTELYSFVDYFKNNYNKIKHPPEFSINPNNATGYVPKGATQFHINYSLHQPFEIKKMFDNTGKPYDRKILDFENFIYENFVPVNCDITVTKAKDRLDPSNIGLCPIFKETKDKVNFIDASFEVMHSEDNLKSYDYITISFKINPQQCPTNRIMGKYSLYQFLKGDIYVHLQPLTPDLTLKYLNGAILNLNSLNLLCGQDYNTSYLYLFNNDSNLISNYADREYMVPVNQVQK